MFDMTDIGRKIAKRRKQLNLTQVELADQLLVSYQAVSQWELGKSMPEISNLTRLSEVLDLPLSELLGQKESQVVQQVVEDEPLSEDDLVEAAPFIKPSAMKKQLKDRPFKGSTLVALAPFVDSDTLMGYINKQGLSGGSLVALAPFLDDEHIDQILDNMSDRNIQTSQLVALAPFASSKSLARLVKKAGSRVSGAQLIALAPFLKGKHLREIVDAKQVEGLNKNWVKVALMPFLDQADIKHMFEANIPQDDPDDVIYVPEEDEAPAEAEQAEAPTEAEEAGAEPGSGPEPKSEESLESILKQLKRFLKSGE